MLSRLRENVFGVPLIYAVTIERQFDFQPVRGGARTPTQTLDKINAAKP